MRLVASAQAEQLELSFVDIFKHPKLGDLATIGSRIDRPGQQEKATQPFELLGNLPSRIATTALLEEVALQCQVSQESIQDAYPTSPLQDALLTLSIKQPGAYIAQHVLALPTTVVISKFKSAWEQAIQEIDILRTRITQLRSGDFVQAVLTTDPIIWREETSLKDAEEEALRLPSHLGAQLASYTLVNSPSGKRHFVWTLHHSLYDGWSIYLMLQRVQQIYQTGVSKMPQIPYTRFVKYLTSTDEDASTNYWKTILSGAAPQHFPQSFHTTNLVSDSQTMQHTLKLAPHKHTDVTPSNVIRAAWALLLAAYTGSDDVAFGETLAGRDIAVSGIMDICGPTLTTVPTRIKIDRGATVSDLLKTVSANITDRIPHQHIGLSAIKSIGEDMMAACNFQNLLVIQTENEELAETMWSVCDNGEQSNFFTYPLVIECKMGPSSTAILAHFDANIISSWYIQCLLYQFESILVQLNTASHVRNLTMFSKHDKELVQKWNAREPEVVEETITSLFLQKTTSQPDAIAVSAFDGEFTYAELAGLASKLANELVELGAGPEQLIPICADKSRWAIVAMMAVLISGAGYVPLSPTDPASRHLQIVEACKASILLCSPSYASRFVGAVDHLFSVSEAAIDQLPASSARVPLRAKSENTCYVIFTSGSTGIPKGVVIEHRSIASNASAICEALHIIPSSRVYQFCTFQFDVSVGETLAVLVCGATICMPSDEQRLTDLASSITALKADWAFLTPSVASTLDGPHVVPTLKTLTAGGEAMTLDVINKWASGVQLQNGYGPTEGTVFAVTNDQVSNQRDPTNIGRMLKSGRAWLTNSENPHQLAPVGSVAELSLEGLLLAREYLNDPERTSESFIENPAFLAEFSGTSSSRIYRTGDLCRYAADGSIQYIGRKDNQIKLAGQRVELGEIEQHLQTDDKIYQVVVQLPKIGPLTNKLVAVVSLPGGNATRSDQVWHTPLTDTETLSRINLVRDRLCDLVPVYMVPAVWIAVPWIPSTSSNKFDKRRVGLWLEGMDETASKRILVTELNEDPEQPANDAVGELRIIWAKVLNRSVDDIKPNSSWMSLGGDSIAAMKLLAKCRSEGINLTLNEVLRAKSITHLAENIKSTVVSHYDKEQTDQPFDISPIQRYYLKTKDVESNAHFNQSSTLRFTRPIKPDAIKRALDSIVACHSMLRARFSRTGNSEQWQQSVVSDVSTAYNFEIHDVLTTSSMASVISHTQKSLNITSGPVLAINLLNMNGEQVLFMAAHHLVVDVVSWGIILGDLEDLLASRSNTTLPKGLPFQAWCEKQAAHALESRQQSVIQKQSFTVQRADFAFWGMEKRPNVYGDVERDEFTLDKNISSMALENHGVLRTDLVDLLLAGILHSFSRVFINRSTPTIFNESHGREVWTSSNIDLSRTVGWFTTLYPVTVPIGEEEDDVMHTIRQVKDARRKITDNGRPYFAHRFLTEDGRKRYADHDSMEVLFNYLGRQEQSGAGDSVVQPMHIEDNEDETSDVGTNTARMALLEISACISDGQISVNFMYNRFSKNQKGIRRWILECQRTLEEIATELAKTDTPQPTMADFPLLPLESYSRLDRVLKTLPSVGIASFSQVEDMYPCSSIQDGMILSQIKSPESYWSSTIFEVRSKRGPVDANKIMEAWKQVVARHPALRTVFIDSVCKGGVFDQIVVKSPDAGIVAYNCSDVELPTLLSSVKHSEINGKKKPALPHQAAVVTTSSGKVVVKVIVNHAVIDGGSLGIIGNDLQEAYEGRLSDDGPRYSDYIKYLRELPANDAITYWKKKLRGVSPCYFPTTSRDLSKHHQLRSLDMRFTRFSELHALAENNNVTFANILLAAWALVLRSYTQTSDVCYGYLTSGRNVPINNIEVAVGAFINMLVSRVEMTSKSSLLEVIQKVQTDFIESMPHQHCSLAQFQHDLGLSGRPLFNTAVSIQNRVANDDSTSAKSDIEFEQLDGHDPSEFAITVNIDATRYDEAVRFTYWSDVVTDGEAKNVSTLMAKFLDQALSNVTQTVAGLDAVVLSRSPQTLLKPRPPIMRSSSSVSNISLSRPHSSSASRPRTPRSPVPNVTPGALAPADTADLSGLIRSIVSEMVPQIVDQIMAHNRPSIEPVSATVDQMTNQMTGLLNRRASYSTSLRDRPILETGSIRSTSFRAGSIRSRRMSNASNAESRIQTAADMVATIGAMATEASSKVAPDFVEKKLLNLWSELLELVEESIEQDDSFFVSLPYGSCIIEC
jgi:amino acid adenylation domain-containing protein/non-ribosomal peptide synthase protein (TIGR01720 family)